MADFRRRALTLRNRPPIPRLTEEEINPSSGWTQYPESHHLLVDLPGFGKDDIKFNVEESGIIVVSGRRRTGEEKQVYFEKSFNVPEDGDIKSINTVFEGDTLKVSIPKVAKDMKQEPEKTDTKKKRLSAESPVASSTEITEEEKAEAGEGLASSSYSEEGKQEPYNNSTLSSNDKKEDKAELIQSTKQHKTQDQKQNIGRDQGYKTSTQGENSSSQASVIVKIIENKGILIASILSFTLGVFLSKKFHPLPPPK